MTNKITDPNVGELGQDPEAFERERLAGDEDWYSRRQREALEAADKLNAEQADIPMREDFGREGESFDTPEMTHSAIAAMAAGRAGARIRAAQGQPPRNIVAPELRSEPGRPLGAARPPTLPSVREAAEVRGPTPAMDLALPEGFSKEMTLVVTHVISELGRGLAQKFDDLKQDLEENTRLLGVMNAPMEAIADSHERASASFETLRRDIAQSRVGLTSSPALEQLTKVIDTAGLSEAQSRAERRFEELARAIEGALQATRIEFKASIDAVALSMVQVLHLLERLQARELREAKRRMTPGDTP